jgi:tetratricopeptide (TPR) repeat protein
MIAIYEGNHTQAERIYKKILVHDEKNYGFEDPFITASTLNNLGDLYCSIKDYPKALIYLEKCLQIRQLKLPKDDLLLAVTKDNLGKVYTFLGRFNEANFLHLKALEVRTNILGKSHPERNNSVINLAMNLYKQEDFFQALPLYLEATYWDSEKFGEFSDYVLYDLMGSLKCIVKIFETDRSVISQKSDSLILQGIKLVKTIFSKVLTGEIYDENLLFSVLTPTIEFLDLFAVKKEVIRDNKIFDNISDLISSDFVPKSIKNDLKLIIQNK